MEQETVNDLETFGFTKPKQKRGLLIGIILTLLSTIAGMFFYYNGKADKKDEKFEIMRTKYEDLLKYIIQDQKQTNKKVDTLNTQKYTL